MVGAAANIPAMDQQIDIELLQQEWAKRYGQLVAELSIAKTMIVEMAARLEAVDADEK
jgi:hypothetical protein